MRQSEFEDAVRYGSELERERSRQRQREGIEAAREKGMKFGRPRIEKSAEFEEVMRDFKVGLLNRRETAEMLGVSMNTFDRWRRTIAHPGSPSKISDSA